MQACIKRLCEAAGVSPLPTHATRHTYATLALDAGVPIKEVSEQLGHASVATTARIYSHAVERQRRAANALGSVLSGAFSGPKLAPRADNGTRESV